ncbi:MAG: TetR/AcrR family transcriptional regulator [Pseudomonadales bacterium]
MSDKRTDIVRSALTLFIGKGIHAVGINEVISEASVAKKTLYHHFASKDEVVLAALEYRDQRFMHWLDAHMQQATAQLSLCAIFTALDEWFNNNALLLGPFRGCFFINASVEFKDVNHPINISCAAHKNRVFERVLQETQVLCHTNDQAIELARTLCLLKEGAITTALVQGNPAAAKEIMPVAVELIKRAAK